MGDSQGPSGAVCAGLNPAEDTNLHTGEQLGENRDGRISQHASSEHVRTWSPRVNLRRPKWVRYDQPLIAAPALDSNLRPGAASGQP